MYKYYDARLHNVSDSTTNYKSKVLEDDSLGKLRERVARMKGWALMSISEVTCNWKDEIVDTRLILKGDISIVIA